MESMKRMPSPDSNRTLPFVTDLGIPIEGEGITCMVSGKEQLYGVTFPTEPILPGGDFLNMAPHLDKASKEAA